MDCVHSASGQSCDRHRSDWLGTLISSLKTDNCNLCSIDGKARRRFLAVCLATKTRQTSVGLDTHDSDRPGGESLRILDRCGRYRTLDLP